VQIHSNETLEELLSRFQIDKWHWLLVGDGSGCDHKHACGWGCVAINRLTFERIPFWGAMNLATVNLAEMMAYIQALNHIEAREENKWKESGKRRVRYVHIITDSDYCRVQGSSKNLLPRKNGALWRIFEDYQRRGLILCWHHAKREDVALNVYADAVSKTARHIIEYHDVRTFVEKRDGQVVRTLRDYNPAS
jgi:ribonuclease HI